MIAPSPDGVILQSKVGGRFAGGKTVRLRIGQNIGSRNVEAKKIFYLSDIRDGEIRTACQQACPTDAIIFGNINDKASRVAKIKTNERTYGVLADINTRPRTTYVAEVLNVNPELAEA